MARIRTIKVFVVGEVIRPGAYEISALNHGVECAVRRLRSGPPGSCVR